MGRNSRESDVPAPEPTLASEPLQYLFWAIQRHLRKDRALPHATHRKIIRRDFRNAREDMVLPTELTTEMLHLLARQRKLKGVVYVHKDTDLDHHAKTDLIAIRPDNTAVVVQATGGPGNASTHRRTLRRHFRNDNLDELPIVVVKVRTHNGRYQTPHELLQIYERPILDTPGIPLRNEQRNLHWE